MKVTRGLPSLRGGRAHAVVVAAFAAMRARGDFRLVHYSVQSNHVHLLCEAKGRTELSDGLRALAIRIAKRLNRLWRRVGKLFADRYHEHVLRTLREVRNALEYVLNNAAKHGVVLARGEIDPCSSAAWFDGWRGRAGETEARESPLAKAQTWLLSVGWRRRGEIAVATSGAAPFVRRE
jgi:REP element-mobilizing transposase RayT